MKKKRKNMFCLPESNRVPHTHTHSQYGNVLVFVYLTTMAVEVSSVIKLTHCNALKRFNRCQLLLFPTDGHRFANSN